MKNLIIILFMLILMSCNEKYPPPLIERCITGKDSWQCFDSRKSKKEQAYDLPPQENYISTNPIDYDRAFAYCADLRKDLIICERKK